MTALKTEAGVNLGRITQIIGPVLDVAFAPNKMPNIYNSLVVEGKNEAGEDCVRGSTFGSHSNSDKWNSKHEPAILEVGMAEADLSNKGLNAGGAIIVGAWISTLMCQ